MAVTSGDSDNAESLSGPRFESMIHEIIDRIAAELGDRYVPTGTIPGFISKSKKGDGFLEVVQIPSAGRGPRVVVEVTTDSTSRRDWFEYLDEAQRNRDAQAALGVVCGLEVPGGLPIRSYGHNKIVVAYDPRRDDSRLLHVVLCGLRGQAIHAARTAPGRDLAARVAQMGRFAELKLDAIESQLTEARRRVGKGVADVEALRAHIVRMMSETPDSWEEEGPGA